MAKISCLAPHVADLIAAGEVVERPASVVKELVENAIDAGATAIVTELQNGGMALIRVTDNGCGIPSGELPTAFLRHATSKLREEGDLGKIATLGFRGEALAAIASVSHLDIFSHIEGETAGASLHLEGGIPSEIVPAGSPQGTTIVVRDLFYNTPARLKFMKKDSAETAAALGLLQHLALSHPQISFRFLKDGVEALATPGDGLLSSAVYAAFGREFALALLPAKGSENGISVRGFVSKPLACRGSRAMQTFFVNGRFIKSQLLTAAVEEGYRNQMMKGRFPGCVLHLELAVSAVDVNVHPAKTVVKFAAEHAVFDAVYHAVLDALEGEQTVAPPKKQENQNFFKSMDAQEFRAQLAARPAESLRSAKPAGTVRAPESAPAALRQTAETSAARTPLRPVTVYFDSKDSPPAYDTELGGKTLVADVLPGVQYATRAANFPPEGGTAAQDAAQNRMRKASQIASQAALQTAAQSGDESVACPANVRTSSARESAQAPMEQMRLGEERSVQQSPAPELPWRIAGELLHTYILCEDEKENIWLIDKHAAHERLLFDRLEAAQEPPLRQQLLQPLAARLSQEDGALLLENLPLLEQLGFLCEEFGEGAILLRELPSEIDADDAEATLEALAEALRSGRDPAVRRQKLLQTMACKAAIKAGMQSDLRELRVLVERVQSGEIRYCPHGRPVAVKMTKYELEKMFKRA